MAEPPVPAPRGRLLPVRLEGLLPLRLPAGTAADLSLDGAAIGSVEAPPGGPARRFFVPVPVSAPGAVLRALDRATGADLEGSPVLLQPPGRAGRIERVAGPFVIGSVEAAAGEDAATVLAFVDDEAVAQARARRGEAGAARLRFVLRLPPAVIEGRPAFVHLALAGGAGPFEGGPIRVGAPAARAPARPPRRAARPLSLAIKIAAPDARNAPHSEDHQTARALKAALERLGWVVRIDPRDRWHRGEATDAALVLRGPERYRPDPGRLNLMWLLGGPDRIEAEEADGFDHVFVASAIALPGLRRRLDAPCSVLHPASDPVLVAPPPERRVETPLLFVGDSGRAFRPMVRWCVERRLPLAIWGAMWEGIVPPDLLRGTHLPREHLPAAYAGAGALLVEHGAARADGFLAQRLFDASAAGCPVLTDPVAGLAEVFGDTIPSVAGAEELAAAAEALSADPAPARARALRAREIVRAGHTVEHRARTIVETVEALGGPRGARVT